MSFTRQHLRCRAERARKRSVLRASKKLGLGVSKRIPPHRFRSFGSSAHRRGFFVPNNLPPPHGGGYCLHYDQVNPFNTRRPAKTTSKDRVGADAAQHDLCNFMYLQRCAVKKIFFKRERKRGREISAPCHDSNNQINLVDEWIIKIEFDISSRS